MSHRSVRLPFGRYRDKRLDEIPLLYLLWLKHECTGLEVELRAAVEAEIKDRLGEGARSSSGATGSASTDGRALVDVRSALKNWYREMAMKYHPDRTLDNGTAMKTFIHGYERLRKLLNVDT